MADMRFPLDLVWLNTHGGVAACPLYEPEGTSASIAVLEVAAGKTRALGIAVGARARTLAGTSAPR
jgi:uncharacterized membrane protein (UPF0127 family)